MSQRNNAVCYWVGNDLRNWENGNIGVGAENKWKMKSSRVRASVEIFNGMLGKCGDGCET